MKRYPLVELVWVDARTILGEMAHEDVPARAQLAERKTSGYLLHEDLDGRTIVAHTVDDDGVCDVTIIPKLWVRSIRPQRKPRTKAVSVYPCAKTPPVEVPTI